jgi:hypothetical protein
MLYTQIDAGPWIFGFGVTLFLALVCLMKWKHRRELLKQARIDRGLRTYVGAQTQQAA